MAISAMGKEYADRFLRIRSSENDLKQLEAGESSSEDEDPDNTAELEPEDDSDEEAIYQANLIRPREIIETSSESTLDYYGVLETTNRNR